MQDATISIVEAEPGHEPGWRVLWDLYCAGELAPEVTAATWKRIIDPASPIGAVLALAGTKVIGFLTYVEHEGTWEVKPVCYIEDLYVARHYRGPELDVGYKMAVHMLKRLQAGEWARGYGITRQNNTLAQQLYNRFGIGQPYIRYVLRSAS